MTDCRRRCGQYALWLRQHAATAIIIIFVGTILAMMIGLTRPTNTIATLALPVAIHRHDPADHQGRPVKVRCGMPPSPEATMTAMDDDDNPMRWRQDKFIFHCKVCGDAYFATFNECAHNERGCTITSSSCTPRRSEDGK